MNHLTCSWKTMQIAKLKEISKLPHIYELLTRSLAPSIWELEDIKKGLLCQVCLAAPDDTLRFCCWAFELFSTSMFGMIFLLLLLLHFCNFFFLLQLFGGSVKKLSSGASFRGDMNVLLVGDPGTSKSQLLQYVHKIAPRGIYTSGRGSSAVGLTAYVAKDPETRETVIFNPISQCFCGMYFTSWALHKRVQTFSMDDLLCNVYWLPSCRF